MRLHVRLGPTADFDSLQRWASKRHFAPQKSSESFRPRPMRKSKHRLALPAIAGAISRAQSASERGRYGNYRHHICFLAGVSNVQKS
jgi:hypothetical protein